MALAGRPASLPRQAVRTSRRAYSSTLRFVPTDRVEPVFGFRGRLPFRSLDDKWRIGKLTNPPESAQGYFQITPFFLPVFGFAGVRGVQRTAEELLFAV